LLLARRRRCFISGLIGLEIWLRLGDHRRLGLLGDRLRFHLGLEIELHELGLRFRGLQLGLGPELGVEGPLLLRLLVGLLVRLRSVFVRLVVDLAGRDLARAALGGGGEGPLDERVLSTRAEEYVVQAEVAVGDGDGLVGVALHPVLGRGSSHQEAWTRAISERTRRACSADAPSSWSAMGSFAMSERGGSSGALS
jgi:hypothetical protein